MKHRTYITFALCALILVVAIPHASAYTIYVDKSNSGAEDGTSWGTAWNTMTEALSNLAATNAVEQGGHTILVTNGTYTGEELKITSSHAGTSSASNSLRAAVVGEVYASDGAQWWLMNFSTVSHFVLDGIQFTDSQTIMYQTSGNNILVRNCVFYDAIFDIDGMNGPNTYEHCLFYKMNGAIWNTDGADDITIRDSIMVRCNPAVDEKYAGGDVYLINTCVWGNDAGIQMIDEGTTAIRTEDQLNSVTGCSGNFVKNPGFASTGAKCNAFYTNSVCLGTATDGGNLGPIYRSWTIVDTPKNTYYVDRVNGSNANTAEQAQNRTTAWNTIAYAAGQVRAGDTVIVMPGTESHTVWASDNSINLGWGGSYDRVADENLPVTFVTATQGTVNVNCVQRGFRVAGKIGGIVLDGFNIYGFYYGGVLVDGGFHITVRNCTIPSSYNGTEGDGVTAGTPNYGGGGCIIEDSEISNCGDHGVENFGIVRRCKIYDNTLYGINAGTVNIENCNIYGNNRGIRLETPNNSPSMPEAGLVENCTIYNNSTRGISTEGSYDIVYRIRNCILMNNAPGIEEISNGTVTFEYCCLTNNATANFQDSANNNYITQADINGTPEGENCIVANPLFEDAGSADFRLDKDSPCIDEGTTPTISQASDFYGNSRLAGGGYDIGSFEWQPSAGTLILVR